MSHVHYLFLLASYLSLSTLSGLQNKSQLKPLDLIKRLIYCYQKLSLMKENMTILKVLKPLLFSLCFFLSATVLAQSGMVTGKVTDKTGTPLPGVSVKVVGKGTGATTAENGTFSVAATPQDALEFSYIGFAQQTIQVGNQSSINVQLAEDSKVLSQVVVVGYATQRKKDLTGAVTVVDVESAKQIPTGQVANQLQGQAAGVSVVGSGQPGQEPNIIIRGLNTFGNNNPLFVVDGVPITNIGNINPNDVASIQVLKDAGAASIYGSRAANGVIIITTKRGSGKPTVSYDAYQGIQVPKRGNVFNKLSPVEMAEMTFAAIRNSAAINGVPVVYNHSLYGSGPQPRLPDYIIAGNSRGVMEGDPAADQSLYYVNPAYTSASDYARFYRITRANKEGTDWYDAIIQNAPITSHNVSIGAGNENGNYLFSFNYFNQEGAVIHTGFNRYSVRSNSQYNISKKLRVGENLTYTLSRNPNIFINSRQSPILHAMNSQTIIPVYDINGNFAGDYGLTGNFNPNNPVAMLERSRNNRSYANRLFGNVFTEVDVADLITLRSSFGGEITNVSSRTFTLPSWENALNTTNGSYAESSADNFNYTWTNTANLKKSFGAHNLNVLFGTEYYTARFHSLTASAQGYYSFDPNYTNLSTGSINRINNSGLTEEALFSLIGRADYQFKDRYLIGATLRRDGSSKFLNNRYGWFPAVSAGWRLSQEDFIKSFSWLTDMKIRGGYGIMGNQLNVNPSNSFSTYTGDPQNSFYDITGSNNAIAEGFARNRLGNPDAVWEKNIQSNIGFDASFLSNRWSITADYYQKNVEDLLFNAPVAATAGAVTVPFVNIASMKNSGLDVSLKNTTTVSTDFTMDIGINLTTYKNEITKVSNTSNYFDDPRQTREFPLSIIRNAVGQPFNSFYGYQLNGFWDDQGEIDQADALAKSSSGNAAAVYQTGVAVGRFRYADVNGDGMITDADRTFLGSPNPAFSYGLNLGFTYKNFDFSAFFYGQAGNEIWNNTRRSLDFVNSQTGAKSKTALYDSWTPERKNAKAPILETEASFSSYGVPNSYFIEDGSYFRAKNMQLGFTLPTNFVEKVKLGSLRVYLQAANLFTITDYSGLDPEVGINSNGAGAVGIDEGNYPSQRQFLVGVNLKF